MSKILNPYTCTHKEYADYLKHQKDLTQSSIKPFVEKLEWLNQMIEEFSDRPDNIVFIESWHPIYEVLQGWDMSD